MEIFIGNLPHRFSQYDLRRVVERALMPKHLGETIRHLFAWSKRIKHADYRVIDEQKPYGIVRYGRVVIEPEAAAVKVLSALQNSIYRGASVNAREFVVRAYINDRRAVGWRSHQWGGQEQRAQDRRQAIFKHPDHYAE